MAGDGAQDLTERMRDVGLSREYEAYKKQCQRHRAKLDRTLSLAPGGADPDSLGSSNGTGTALRGSLTQSLRRPRPASNPSMFEEYYPTQRKFMWHHTAAYWTAVLFVQGSLLFTLSSGIELFKESLGWRPESVRMLTLWPNFIGGVMFNIGAYCSYLNLINLKKERDEPIEYFVANWARVRQNHSEVTSRVGTMAYFNGATIFSVGVVFSFFEMPSAGTYILVTLPGVIGSVCFVIGGVCELLHNGVFTCLGKTHGEEEDEAVVGHRSTWRDAAWWISILNTVGGANFLLGYLPGLFFWKGEAAEVFGAANFFFGSMIFIVTSWLLVLMWKHNDFGGALIRQLNDAIGSGTAVRRVRRQNGQHTVQIEVREEVSSPAHLGDHADAGSESSMSLRGALFIGIYCWLSFIAIINTICLALWDMHSAEFKKHSLRLFSSVSSQVFLILGVMLVIGMHSTVTSVPKEEPYRALVILSRLVLFLLAIGQTLSFLDFFWVPFDDVVLFA